MSVLQMFLLMILYYQYFIFDKLFTLYKKLPYLVQCFISVPNTYDPYIVVHVLLSPHKFACLTCCYD